MNPAVKEVEDLVGITLTKAEILKMPLRKFEAYLKQASPGEIEDLVDGRIRHKKGNPLPYEYLQHWLKFGRVFGCATNDSSWGEFEKEFSIMVRRLILAERVLKSLGIESARDYEENQNSRNEDSTV